MDIKSFIKTLAKRPGNLGRFVQFCLLGAWSLFQYTRGNELYAACIVLLFVVLSMPRLQSFMVIGAFVVVIVLFKTPVLDTWIEIREANLLAFQSFKPSIARLFTPNSGRDALPKHVQQMLSLIEENNIPDYRLSDSYEQNQEINQRIVESAWPLKKEASSQYILLPVEEIKALIGCIETGKRKDVALVYCP
jgi:hypothetical protein